MNGFFANELMGFYQDMEKAKEENKEYLIVSQHYFRNMIMKPYDSGRNGSKFRGFTVLFDDSLRSGEYKFK